MTELKRTALAAALAAGVLAAGGCVTRPKHQQIVSQLEQTQQQLVQAGTERDAAKSDLAEAKVLLGKAQKDIVDAKAEEGRGDRLKQAEINRLTGELTRLKKTADVATAAENTKDRQLAAEKAANVALKAEIAKLTRRVAALAAEIRRLQPASPPAPTTPKMD